MTSKSEGDLLIRCRCAEASTLMVMKNAQDAYGHEVYDFLTGNNLALPEIVERDDGYVAQSAGPKFYFADFKEWDIGERKAMRYAKGRVLDIGCGAGRVSLYLEKKGFDVLGVDNSPLAIRTCKKRGLRRALVLPVTQLTSKLGKFDTIIMFGNNFGLFGNPKRARWLLKRFRSMTSESARILADSADPYKTTNPDHLSYHRFNVRRGRMAGQLRIRVLYRKYRTPWFDYLIVSRQEVRKILRGTGWRLRRTFRSKGPVYTAIIEKQTP